MEQRNSSVPGLVLTALFTAVTLLCTFIIKIPVGTYTYIHLGDAIIFLGAMILPRKSARFAGAVGAMLADLLGGYAIWAPFTCIIKYVVIDIFRFFVDRSKAKLDAAEAEGGSGAKKSYGLLGVPALEIAGYAVASAFGIIAYFGVEYFLYGNALAAALGMPMNVIQMGAGAIVAILLSKALARTPLGEYMYYKR